MVAVNLKPFSAVFALTIAVITSANAAIVFTENFDSENGGAASASYTSFANFSLVPGSGPAKLTDVGCVTGLCVTLAAPNPTYPDPVLLISGSFAFNAFDLIQVSYELSGGGGALPPGSYGYYTNFTFDHALSWTEVGAVYTNLTDSWGPPLAPETQVGRTNIIDASAPFATQTFYVRPTEAGTVQFRIHLAGLSSPGPTLDNVRLEITPVPESSSVLALLAGLVGLGIKKARARLSKID